MGKIYNLFKESLVAVTDYYMLLVEETKSERLVGSTNEWVLDNYYMISEQEKVMKVELKSVEKGEWRVEKSRIQVLWNLLESYLRRCHFQVDKALLFRYLTQVQQRQKDYLSYPEVTALLPLAKAVLISELAALCRRLDEQKAYLFQPTDKSQADMEYLNKAAMDNLLMMNIFNSLKKLTKLPMAELLDYGIDPMAINRSIKNVFTLPRLRFFGFAMANRLEVHGDVALMRLSRADIESYGMKSPELTGLINEVMLLRDVDCGILVREEVDSVRLSLRSKSRYDVNQIASRLFGGGGHARAAGATSHLPFEATIDTVKQHFGF